MTIAKKSSVERQALDTFKTQLSWRIMSDRRRVVRRIEECMEQLDGLRHSLGEAMVEPLLQDYAAVLSILRSPPQSALPTGAELENCAEVLNDLRARLGAVTANLVQQPAARPVAGPPETEEV